MTRYVDPVIHPIKSIRLVGLTTAIGGEGGAMDRAVVVIATFIIGIAIEGIVGDQTISQTAQAGVLVVLATLRPWCIC